MDPDFLAEMDATELGPPVAPNLSRAKSALEEALATELFRAVKNVFFFICNLP